MSHSPKKLLPIGLATLMAAPIMLGQVGSADADVRVRVGGKIKVRVHTRVRVRPRRWRVRTWTRRPHIRLHIGAWGYAGIVTGGFAQPPPPPPPPNVGYDCEPDVPAYYTEPPPPPPAYRPRRPLPPSAPVIVRTRHRQPLPRLAIGAFAGSMEVENGAEGADVGLLARYRLGRHLFIEGEIGKSELADGDRVDKRMGGALLWDFNARAKLSPHLLVGAGITRAEVGADWNQEQRYGEVGAGLTYRLTRNLQLGVDIRAGSRSGADDAPDSMDPVLRSVAPAVNQEESYTRARLSALMYF